MLEKYVKILKKDGIGILATDTLYGVVGSAFSKKAVARIYELKGRDENKPFIILITDVKDLQKFGLNERLIRTNKRIVQYSMLNMLNKFFKPKTSVILPVEKGMQNKLKYLHRGQNSLAFRLIIKNSKNKKNDSNKNLYEIIKKVGPLVAPSANPQGQKPAENITEAKKYFGQNVDFYINSGVRKGKASRIISLVSGKVEIIRE